MAQPHASSSRPPAPKVALTLENDLIGKLKPSKVFPDAVERADPSSPGLAGENARANQITSLSFDDSGERCLIAGEDNAFTLWDMRKGKLIKRYMSQKYGAGLARFTHRPGNIVHASTLGNDHALRYHSTHDNKYLSYFKGHTARVRSLHMNPMDDTFISAGDDGTVRLWDLRLPECKGMLNDMGGSVIAAFDNTGKVFAVACTKTQTISMYATENFDSMPFLSNTITDSALLAISVPPPPINFTSLSFSSNGNYLLVGTSSDTHYLLCAFHLTPILRLRGHRALGDASGEEVSFTGDSRYVVSGSADGAVYFWDLGLEKLEAEKRPDGTSVEAPVRQASVVVQGAGAQGQRKGSRAVRFSPRLCVLAVGGDELSFWLPGGDEGDKVDEGY